MAKTFADIQLGATGSLKRVITAKDIDACFRLAGVYGAMQDTAESKGLLIGDRVAHGSVAIGMAAELLSSWLTGPGDNLVSIDARFLDAIRLGDTLLVTGEVTDKQPQGRLVSVALSFTNQEKVEVASGAVTVEVTRAS